MDLIVEYLPLVIGLVVAGLFVVGLGLALRTETGRQGLADGAIRLALALLALAEGWLAGVIGSRAKMGRVQQARAALGEE